MTSCPVPGNRLQTQGDLAADNRQLEAALVSCGLQVETIKECQEQHDAETETAAVMVPVLAWLRENQPDIMATEEKRRTGFTFKADVLSDTLCDISIDLQLTERVIVKQDGDALHVNHIGEPPLPDNVNRPLQLYVHGELVSELTL